MLHGVIEVVLTLGHAVPAGGLQNEQWEGA